MLHPLRACVHALHTFLFLILLLIIIILPCAAVRAASVSDDLAAPISVPPEGGCASLGPRYFYDTTSFVCRKCENTSVASAVAGAASGAAPTPSAPCECPPGFRNVGAEDFGTRCVRCPQASSRDRLRCAVCDAASGAALSAVDNSSNARACVCPDARWRLVESPSPGNTSVDLQACVRCPNDTLADPADAFVCVSCGPGRTANQTRCMCKPGRGLAPVAGAGNACAPAGQLTALAGTVDTDALFVDVRTEGSSARSTVVVGDSAPVVELYEAAGTRCASVREPAACQTLANLCVLAHYDRDASACALLDELADSGDASDGIHGISGWTDGLPFIAYSLEETAAARESAEVTMRFEFALSSDETTEGTTTDTLAFELARYSLDGALAALEPLGSHLQLCGTRSTRFLSFGTTHSESCILDLGAAVVGAADTDFFELFFRDTGGVLRAVPVRLLNLREGGSAINEPVRVPGTSRTEPAKTEKFVRRFFLYDNLSGRSHALSAAPEVVRFAESIELDIVLRGDGSESILLPVLTLRHSERSVADVAADRGERLGARNDSTRIRSASIGFPSVSFAVSYTKSSTRAFRAWWITALIAGCVAGAVLAVFRMFKWTRRELNQQLTGRLLLKLLSCVGSAAADVFFVLTVAFPAFFLLFFKGQDHTSVLLPPPAYESRIWALVLVAFAGRVVNVLELVVSQCSAALFFVDWEKSKGRIVGDKDTSVKAPVSVWRTLFVANEWSEIQTLRSTHVRLSVLALLVLLEGFGLGYWATPQPDAGDLSRGTTDWMLRYGVAALFWLAIALVQVTVNRLVRYRFFGDPVCHFADLCSVANVSVFALLDRCYGFYIHGRTVHTFADTNMAGLIADLRREEENLTGTRGLEASSDVQVFRAHFTSDFREHYDRIYGLLLEEDLRRRAGQAPGSTLPLMRLPKDKHTPAEKAAHAHHALTLFLQGFIDKTQPDFPYQILPAPTWAQRIFDFPPDMSFAKESLLVPDPRGHSFAELTFFGHEWELITFNILSFAVADMLLRNSVLAGVFAVLADVLLCRLRNWRGAMNIVTKTMVDDRFLL